MGNAQKSKSEPVIKHKDMTNTSIQESGLSSHQETKASFNISDGQCAISRMDTASYIHDMATELKALAETANFSFLAYLLELAIEESAAQQRGRI